MLRVNVGDLLWEVIRRGVCFSVCVCVCVCVCACVSACLCARASPDFSSNEITL